MCFGIARNFLTIFLAHSSNECVLYLSCNLFAINQYRFVAIFYCNFHFPNSQSHPGYFHQKSNRVITFGNVITILLLLCSFLYVFILIKNQLRE